MTTASVNARIQLIVKGQSQESTCSPSLAKGPWEFDGGPVAYGPGASSEDVIPSNSPKQGVLPDEYKTATDEGNPWQQGGNSWSLLSARRDRAARRLSWRFFSTC